MVKFEPSNGTYKTGVANSKFIDTLALPTLPTLSVKSNINETEISGVPFELEKI